jgi:hypothetical protein
MIMVGWLRWELIPSSSTQIQPTLSRGISLFSTDIPWSVCPESELCFMRLCILQSFGRDWAEKLTSTEFNVGSIRCSCSCAGGSPKLTCADVFDLILRRWRQAVIGDETNTLSCGSAYQAGDHATICFVLCLLACLLVLLRRDWTGDLKNTAHSQPTTTWDPAVRVHQSCTLDSAAKRRGYNRTDGRCSCLLGTG